MRNNTISDLFTLKEVKISGELFEEIYNYLAEKPYSEVWQLIDKLRSNRSLPPFSYTDTYIDDYVKSIKPTIKKK